MQKNCAEIKNGVLVKYIDNGVLPFPIYGDIVSCEVNEIGEYAFKDCKEIQELYIPWYVKKIPETNFVDRSGVFKKMLQSPNFTIYGEKDTEAERVAKQAGVKFIETDIWKNDNKLYAYFGRSEKFVMPEGIGVVYGEIFSCAPHVVEVVLPSTLVVIFSRAFYNCKKIQKIIIPKNVNSLGSEVFKNCKSLTEAIFENGETKLDNCCFKGCPEMLVIKAPAGGFVEEYAKKYNIKFEAI